MKTIELTDKELKLLIMILEEAKEERTNMGCNDPYEDEEKIFTKEERKEMGKSIEDHDFPDGFLFNMDYVSYIINKIKSQNGLR